MIRAGYDSGNIRVIYPPAPEAIDPVPLPRGGTARMLFLGRMTPQKGLSWLIDALALTKHPVHLDVGGTGYMEPEIRTRVKALGLGDRVTFHGWLDEHGVVELIRASRALIFPSLWHEPFGLVALEAMVNARPVIASRVGGIPEIVTDGETGILVPPNDSIALAAAIDQLWDLSFARQLGDEGLRSARAKFAIADHMLALLDAYGDQTNLPIHDVAAAQLTGCNG